MSGEGHTGPIVVGVDGSSQSLAALEWAAEEASLKKVDLHVVVAWHIPNMFGGPIPLPENFDPVGPAEGVLKEAQEWVTGKHPELVVKGDVVEGFAARALMGTAEALGASLLVVGARGHGEISGMLIGSVSENVASHAKCPVVVVRHWSH
jgi:nucleotide-binding universal stress UspA family protein